MNPRTLMISVGLALAGLGVSASAASASTRVYVTPGAGRPSTHFTLRFRSPDRTGRVGSIRRTDRLIISGPRQRDCISSVNLKIIPVSQGARVKIALRPGLGAGWCAGRFRGRIVETEALICPGTCAGPSIPPPRTIARFSFRVIKPVTTPPSSAPSASGGPVFAGLSKATLCAAGGANPASRSYMLSWNAATDPATASDKIVYEIYYASTSGGENFSSPLATTGPGATSYSGSVPGSGSAYFVVRARDSAGHEDHNTVERQAVNTC